MILFIGGLGPVEIGLIVLLVILLFGASRIPKIARGLGQSTKEFHRGREEINRELDDTDHN